MRFFILLILLFSISFLSAKKHKVANNSRVSGQTFLLAYPRSGTNYVVGILQAFFNRPIDGNIKKAGEINRLNLNLIQGNPLLYRTHKKKDLRMIYQPNNKLLFILRNYKECITKHAYWLYPNFSEKEFIESIIDLKGRYFFKQYIKNLKFYDNWHGKKLLIYYEDLITNPKETILKLISFFDQKLSLKPEDFFDNFEFYRNTIYESYHSEWGQLPKSDGLSEIWHSKNFSKYTIETADNHIKNTYPNLWNKYLKRYGN